MAEGKASILLVDDHAVIAAAMVVALQSEGFGPVIAANAADLSIESVLAQAAAMKPDIVLVDLYLGGGRLGTAMITPLIALGAKVLLFTASTDARLIAAGLRAGAEAVVDKAMSFDKVVGTLDALIADQELMPRLERDALIEALEQQIAQTEGRRRPFNSLTEREAEVMLGLIDGKSPKQIAHEAGISVSTVRGHIERIFHKLSVSSQREALALARTAGWPGGTSTSSSASSS